jgi:signal transduction histidine kinase
LNIDYGHAKWPESSAGPGGRSHSVLPAFPGLVRYGAAVAAVAIAIGVRALFNPLWGPTDYPTGFFTAAVVFAAWFGRMGPGLFAIALSAAAITYFHMEPIHSFVITAQNAPALIIFSIVGLSIVIAIEAMHRSNDRAQRALAEVAAADRQKAEFLAVLAHELRNPLAPISGAAYLLKKSSDSHPWLRQISDVIDRQLHQLTRLVDDLLDVARATRGKIDLKPELMNMSDAVALAVEAARPLIDAKGQGLSIRLTQEPVYVVGDLTRLSQVVSNLLSNAAKYSGKSGRIEVILGRKANSVTVTVRDHGMGIAPELLPRIFDLFVQGDDNLAHSNGGLGVGLTLVKKIVELHGGDVKVFSEGRGKGSEFVISLPSSPHVVVPSPAGKQELKNTASPRRILVVDDNVDAANVLGMLLKSMGHRVDVEYDGKSALVVSRDLLPDVILLDIGLPGMDGYEVAKAIRGNPDTRDIRIIAVTGYGRSEDRARSRQAGINHHLTKPIEPDALNRLITEPS